MNFKKDLILENKILKNDNNIKFDEYVDLFFKKRNTPIKFLSFGNFTKKGKDYSFKSRSKVSVEAAQDLRAYGLNAELEMSNLISETFLNEIINSIFKNFRNQKEKVFSKVLVEKNKPNDIIFLIKKILKSNQKYQLIASVEILEFIIRSELKVEEKINSETIFSNRCFVVGNLEIFQFPYAYYNEFCFVKNLNDVEFFYEKYKDKHVDPITFMASYIYCINYNIPNILEFEFYKLKNIERKF